MLVMLFFSGGMRGFSFPYFNLYLDDQGVSSTLIGTILSVAALLELFMIPLFSRWADRTRTHRLLFRGLMLSYAAACIVMLLFPNRNVLFAAMLLVNVNLAGTFVFGMQLAFTILDQHGKSFFGGVRSASAGGFTVASLLSSLLFSIGRFSALFSAAFVSGAIAVGLSNVMPQSTSDKPTKTNGTAVARSRGFYIILASQFFAIWGMRNGFAFWLLHFENNVGISYTLIPIIVGLSGLFELPFYYLLDRLGGHSRAATSYIVGAIGLGVFWFFTGIIPGFWAIVGILIFRGLAFALWSVAVLVLINQISHPSNVSTNQAIAQITVPSIAALVSGAPMGYIYEHYPPLIFFCICGAMMILGAMVMLVSQRFLGVRLNTRDAAA